MAEQRLQLRKRGPYEPDQVTKDQVEDINKMMESFDQMKAAVVSNSIEQYIALYGEIAPETIDAMKQLGEAFRGNILELFKTEFCVTGLSRLQGIIRNPNISPTFALRALEMGFKINAMIPKAPLIAVQHNTQNNHYEGMLAQAESMPALNKPNGNGSSGNSGNPQ